MKGIWMISFHKPRSVIHTSDSKLLHTHLIVHVGFQKLHSVVPLIPRLNHFLRIFRYGKVKAMNAWLEASPDEMANRA